jgi:hypothetical protein
MGVKGEARPRSIVQDGDNVGPPRRVFAKGEIEPGGQQPAFQTFGGFTLMARWISVLMATSVAKSFFIRALST